MIYIIRDFFVFFFFFNDTATTEIYTLSLHDALPIGIVIPRTSDDVVEAVRICRDYRAPVLAQDRKSTRLNSSHMSISYAVFCLKKKKKNYMQFYFQKKKKKNKY